MHCCKRVWKLPYTRLRRSSSIAATSSTVACLSSRIVTIRLRNTRSFRNPHRKKSGTVRSGDRAGQAMSPKLRTQVTRCCTFQRSIAIDYMKWRPLLYRSSSRQPRQAITTAQYSNLKCVSRLRAILYIPMSLLWLNRVLQKHVVNIIHVVFSAIFGKVLKQELLLSWIPSRRWPKNSESRSFTTILYILYITESNHTRFVDILIVAYLTARNKGNMKTRNWFFSRPLQLIILYQPTVTCHETERVVTINKG